MILPPMEPAPPEISPFYGDFTLDDPNQFMWRITEYPDPYWNNREDLNDTTSIKYYLFISLKRKLVDVLKSPGIRLKMEEDVVDFEKGL